MMRIATGGVVYVSTDVVFNALLIQTSVSLLKLELISPALLLMLVPMLLDSIAAMKCLDVSS